MFFIEKEDGWLVRFPFNTWLWIKVNKSEIKDYEDKIRKLIDIDNPSRELIQALIDKIIIDKDRNIEIIYKFSILNH